MKAVVFHGPRDVRVENVDDPSIQEPTDAIVRLTTSALCGSDLHKYEGRTPAQPGLIFGHEPLGVVEEAGPGVRAIRRGNRVVMPFNTSCGFCWNCSRGYFNARTTCNPDSAGAAYGYVGMGPHRGGQAQFLRVPYADVNCLKLPGEPRLRRHPDRLRQGLAGPADPRDAAGEPRHHRSAASWRGEDAGRDGRHRRGGLPGERRFGPRARASHDREARPAGAGL